MEKQKLKEIIENRYNQIIKSQQTTNTMKTRNNATMFADKMRDESLKIIDNKSFKIDDLMNTIKNYSDKIIKTQNSVNKLVLILDGLLSDLTFETNRKK